MLEMTEYVLPLQSILCYTNRLYPFHVNVKLKKIYSLHCGSPYYFNYTSN